ncbi:MAG: translation initiation factor IF-2 [Spirochaetia bacterium]|jgi:translation initiation factor IF-2|nr:translation initiation factor IF-2 [Spirochaetia bacterium]
MSEVKKPTLIKQPKTTTANDEAKSRPERKKVVRVKKKVIIVKSQPVKPSKFVQPDTGTGTAATSQQRNVTESEPKKQKDKAAKEFEGKTIAGNSVVRPGLGKPITRKGISPLHNGPVIIRSKNLPPVPNQGQTAKDHAEWQSKNPGVIEQEMPVPSQGPRIAGTVGGKPAPGSRPTRTYNRNNNYNGGGRNFSGNSRSGGYNNRGGYNAGGRPSTGFGSNNRPGGGYAGRSGGGYAGRPGGGYAGGRPGSNNRPGGGFRPRTGGSNNGTSDRPMVDTGKTQKRSQNRNSKKNYQKRDAKMEKEFQIQRKREQVAAKLAAVPKSIDMMESITVADLAKKMNLKATDIISKLFSMGQMVTINQMIDHETAEIIASEYNCEVHLVSLYDETIIESDKDTKEDLKPRAPIVTIMGHVDHGKTKLLDAIRSTNVAGGEFGGITQHIGAYKVNLKDRGNIVFLDTPGHAAFTMMRARGAQVTDIVVLVVAANDGVMPQTREAIDHARAAKVPIIVAINKCDLPEANPERVMQQLSDLGLMPEEWGGQTLYCKISALKKQGIDELLDTILLESEILELKANPDCRAEGKVLESRIDQGRGTVATVLIQRGTLHQGDYYVAGIYPGRVRAMFNDTGKKISEAGPSSPVEIIGLSNIPSAGDPFQVTEDERQARMVGAKRQELQKLGTMASENKFTLQNMYSKIKEGNMKEFNVIIKGDVQGSVEALQGSLEKLSNNEIKLNVIRASAGAIIESDITLASASDALVIGFNVRPTPRAQALADQEKVEIRKYNIIYDVVDDVTAAMAGLLSPVIKEVDIGKVEVRDTFKVPKIGIIAGCYVTEGKVKRNSLVRVIRDNIQISKDLIKLTSLKRFKDDAKEVAVGFECGIGLENFQDIKVGDIFEIVETQEVARNLEEVKQDESVQSGQD